MRSSSVVYDAPRALRRHARGLREDEADRPDEHHGEFCAYRVEDDLLMCTADQTLVLVAVPERRPTPISDEYRRAIADFEGADLEETVSAA